MSHSRGVLLIAAVMAVTAPLEAQTGRPMTCGNWRGDAAQGTLCTLTRDDTLRGNVIPAGTRLRFDSLGVLKFAWFVQNVTFDGLVLRGSSDGPHHTFYPDGTPNMLWLAHTQVVQGVPCRPISFWTEVFGGTSGVFFHPNGRLKSCRLGRSATVQGVAFAARARIMLDADGRVVRDRAR